MFFFFQAEDGIRDRSPSRGLGDVYKRQTLNIDEAAGDTVDERIELSPQPQASVVVMDQYTGQIKAIVGGRGEKTSSLSLNRATDSYRQPGSCFKILASYAVSYTHLTLPTKRIV